MTDTMAHPSCHNLHRVRPLRAAITWLAFVALLNNVLFPATISIAVGAVTLSLCSARADPDLPGKAKPNLIVRHCALCAAPAALPPRPRAGLPLPSEVVKGIHPQLRVIALIASFRRGPVQARAPPIVA
jgi:hypothetical protein